MSDYQSPGQSPWDSVPPQDQPPSPYPADPSPYSNDVTTPYGTPGSYPQPGSYPPPGYGQPGFGPGGYGGPGYPPPSNNGLSIAALVCGICGFLCVTGILGVIFGFVGLNQIKRTGQRGRGMAIAGIVCGLAWLTLIVISAATGHTHFSTGSDPDSGN